MLAQHKYKPIKILKKKRKNEEDFDNSTINQLFSIATLLRLNTCGHWIEVLAKLSQIGHLQRARNGKDKVDGEARTRVMHTCTSRRVGERQLRKGKDGGDMVRLGGLKLDVRKCPLSPSGVQCTLPNSHLTPLNFYIIIIIFPKEI